MKKKTIKKVIKSKMEAWLSTIGDEKLRKDVSDNLIVSGGCIASMFLNENVSDYDVYIKNQDVLLKLAIYYCGKENVLDGRKREEYLSQWGEVEDDFASQDYVRRKTLKPDQVKLDISGAGSRIDLPDNHDPYTPVFLSQNAISLSDQVQIVLRFSGTIEEIHKNFDFVHATNFFTMKGGVVTNINAMESIVSRDLKYQGSLYPLTSIIRMKKFILRKWTISAGEILKILFHVSELDLKNVDTLEEQLIGVDVAYFSMLIEILRGSGKETITKEYLSTLIDRIFNESEEEN